MTTGPQPTHYYFENCLVLSTIFGKQGNYWSRFVAFLIVWILILFVGAATAGMLKGNDKLVGFLDDVVLLGAIALMLWSTGAILFVIARFDAMLTAMPKFIRGGSDENAREIHLEVEEIRQFVSIRTSRAKLMYAAVLAIFLIGFLIFQIYIPIFTNMPVRAWTMSPQEAPVSYAVSTLWNFIYGPFVIGNICWLMLSTIISVTSAIRRHAKRGDILLAPIWSDQARAIATIGDLSFANSLFFACGLFFVIPWTWFYSTTLQAVTYVTAYLVLMVGVGVWPAFVARGALAKSKSDYLRQLGNAFSARLNVLVSGLANTTPYSATSLPSGNPDLSDLVAIDLLYRRIEGMWSWPVRGGPSLIVFVSNGLAAVAALVLKHFA